MGSKKKPTKKSKRNDAIARRDFLEADLRNLSVLSWRETRGSASIVSTIAKKQTPTNNGIEEHVKREGKPVIADESAQGS